MIMAIKQKKNERQIVKQRPSGWKKPVAGWENRGPAPEITEDTLNPRNVKEKISIWLDQDVLDSIRDAAKQSGEKYQPLINRVLRQIFLPSNSHAPRSVDDLALQLKALWAVVEELKKNSRT
jgi:uncharacterized protein (DUF4415 family)